MHLKREKGARGIAAQAEHSKVEVFVGRHDILSLMKMLPIDVPVSGAKSAMAASVTLLPCCVCVCGPGDPASVCVATYQGYLGVCGVSTMKTRSDTFFVFRVRPAWVPGANYGSSKYSKMAVIMPSR